MICVESSIRLTGTEGGSWLATIMLTPLWRISRTTSTNPDTKSGLSMYLCASSNTTSLLKLRPSTRASAIETAPSVSFAPATAQDVANDVSQELIRRRSLAPGVPTLGTAAFLSPVRDRSVSWDESDRLIYPRAGDTNAPSQSSLAGGPINMIQEASSLPPVFAGRTDLRL